MRVAEPAQFTNELGVEAVIPCAGELDEVEAIAKRTQIPDVIRRDAVVSRSDQRIERQTRIAEGSHVADVLCADAMIARLRELVERETVAKLTEVSHVLRRDPVVPGTDQR